MGTENPKDSLNGMDWKTFGEPAQKEPSAGTIVKKRLPKKMRQIPDCYFLPRKSIPSTIAFYGAWIVAGIGAGMLTEAWMKKKVKEDGGIIWEFDK